MHRPNSRPLWDEMFIVPTGNFSRDVARRFRSREIGRLRESSFPRNPNISPSHLPHFGRDVKIRTHTGRMDDIHSKDETTRRILQSRKSLGRHRNVIRSILQTFLVESWFSMTTSRGSLAFVSRLPAGSHFGPMGTDGRCLGRARRLTTRLGMGGESREFSFRGGRTGASTESATASTLLSRGVVDLDFVSRPLHHRLRLGSGRDG